MTAQQKSLRDQENERQWKMLQAARAREQQIQQQMVGGGSGEGIQSPMDPNAMGMQSPTGFLPPASKPRPGNFPQSGLIRPMSVQIPRQRVGQNPFSPQSQSSQSPMEQYPSSPAQGMMDMVTHSPSMDQAHDSLTQSPHTPRSFDMQSPTSAMSRSPAYSGGGPAVGPMQPGTNPYTMPPGTPRPGQTTNQSRPTVYARDMFGGQFSFPQDQYHNANQQQPQQQQQHVVGQAVQNPNMPQSPHDGNRQLRDLLQRQQQSAPSSPSMGNTPQSPGGWNMDGNGMENQGQQHSPMMMQGMGSDNNTFRLPLPPGGGARPQRMQINQNMMRGPGPVLNAPRPVEIRQRMVRPKNMQQGPMQLQQMQQQQYGQPQTMMHPNQQQFNTLRMQGGMLVNSNQVASGNAPGMQQQVQQGGRPQSVNQEQLISGSAQEQATNEQHEVAMIAESLQQNIGGGGVSAAAGASGGGTAQAGEGESAEIPDNVTADLETLEQEDLFDDDLFGDFNILEYADPELDTLNDDDKSNILDTLELDEQAEGGGSGVKEEKPKKEADISSYMANTSSSSGESASTSGNLSNNPMMAPQQSLGQQQQMDANALGGGGGGLNKDGQGAESHFQNPQNAMQPQQQQHQQQQGLPQQQQQQQQQLQQRVYQMKQPMQIPPNIQQIQQQMISQIQQSAAMGKIVPPGTQFSSNGVIGTVTANNQIQFTYSGVIR